MAYKNNDESDPLGLIEECNGNQKELDEYYDRWDLIYGVPPHSYEVYVLTDGTRPIRLNFGPLEFYYEPFYVGYGRVRKRVKESMALGRQKDKYSLKVARMIEIIEVRGGRIRPVIIGRYYTKEKAALVERKIMNTIHRSFLTNSTLNYCEIPLIRDDCNIMCKNYNEVAGVLKC